MFPSDLKDKNGASIKEDDVIYDNNHYYRLSWNEFADGTEMPKNPNVEGISCTNGYLHHINQETLNGFERIGTYEENKQLFECD